MGLKGKVALVGSVLAVLVIAGQATGVLAGVYDWIRPYAGRATEIIVSGWQYDRAKSELRDVNDRIRRLQERKKIVGIPTEKFPRGRDLSKDDEYELQKLYRDQGKLEKVLRYIDKTQMPYAK